VINERKNILLGKEEH